MHPEIDRICVLAIALLLWASGCGSGHPSVSGKITLDGQPAEGVKVLFSPISTKENPFPGPYAEGKTDAEGNYTLVTRDGVEGATQGKNIVEFYTSKKFEVSFLESEAEIQFAQAGGDKSHPAYGAGVELVQKIKSIKSLSSGDALTPGAKTSFVVPIAGTNAANFEMMDFVKSKNRSQR